jgi:hypothetical protein
MHVKDKREATSKDCYEVAREEKIVPSSVDIRMHEYRNYNSILRYLITHVPHR